MRIHEVFQQNQLSLRIQAPERRLDQLQDCVGAKTLLAHARQEYAVGDYARASEDVNSALRLLDDVR